jgi:hypothetical protein
VSKSFRPRGFRRKPRHPAKTRDVTPVFSVTYAHAAARAVSLQPTPPIEKANANAVSGAQISGKSRPNQRHPDPGYMGRSPRESVFRRLKWTAGLSEQRHRVESPPNTNVAGTVSGDSRKDQRSARKSNRRRAQRSRFSDSDAALE